MAESTANYVKSNSPKGTTKWFDSYQAAANFKQEKANVAISQGYEIAYKTAPTFEKNCINK